MHEARALLLALQEERRSMPGAKKEALRQKIIQGVRSEQVLRDQSRTTNKRLARHWGAIAAALVILLVSCVLLYRWEKSSTVEKQFATAYGEIKTFALPDGSLVTLNGNSAIGYRCEDQTAGPREVWLKGEAFFEVSKRKTPVNQDNSEAIAFIVHTKNLTVEVLGTRFNVRHRRDQTQVVLEEGSVQLSLEEQGHGLRMAPGELVEVQLGEQQINPQPVKAAEYTAWKEGLIRFEGASFSEISQLLADNYGLTLHFDDKKQADAINLKGSFPADNIEVLLEAIANVTHTTIKREGTKIIYQ